MITPETVASMATGAHRPPCPTHAEYLNVVEASMAAYADNTRRTYRTHWRRLVETFADERVDDIGVSALQRLMGEVIGSARSHHLSKADGSGAALMFRAACIKFYDRAVRDNLRSDNPALLLETPLGVENLRRGLERHEVDDILAAIDSGAATSDPALDGLIVRLSVESGARRSAILGLTVSDLNPARAALRMRRQKRGRAWEVPVHRALLDACLDHAASRGATGPDDLVFRTKRNGGTPICSGHFDVLWGNIRSVMPRAEAEGWSHHWLKHTCLTNIARVSSEDVAGHWGGHRSQRVTGGYIRAAYPWDRLIEVHDAAFPDTPIGPSTEDPGGARRLRAV